MPKAKHCIECGAILPDAVPGGLCSACALRGALTPAIGDVEVAPSQFCGARSFGDYELLEEIARGGMGVVYRARQKSLDRLVAVKVLLASQFAKPESVQRFHTEAAAIAQLQHPNIVAIHEVGEHEGQPYFSMDFVEGRTLAELVHERPLPANRAATYLKAIAEAVHYAHQHGVLHRDLKPSNVLIDASDQPRITDFGLAKRLTSDFGVRTSDLTLTGQVLGSPNYMPPEQATGKRGTLSRRSDVYALGAILYHALTGRPPFVGEGLAETVQQVLDVEPVSPRILNASVPRDLETICLKCLEKEPSRRYASAQAVADELGRFLRTEPILAHPVGFAGKAWRWCRRKPALATALGAVILVAVAGFAGILSQWRRADAQRDAAVQARIHADQERYDAAISEAQLLIEQNRFDRAREILAREGQEGFRGWEWGWLQRLCNQDLMTLTHDAPIIPVAFSPDGHYLAAAGYAKETTLSDLEQGRTVRIFKGHTSRVWSIAFSPDGQKLLTAGMDNTARIWDVVSGRQLQVLTNADAVFDAVFSPDGKTIATASLFAGASLWDARSGALLGQRLGHEQAVASVAFSPDGQRLACAGGRWVLDNDSDTTVSIFESATGRRLLHFKAHHQVIHRVRFSPDGTLLATASGDGTARLWNAQTGVEVRLLQTKFDREGIMGLDFSPDGRWLAASGLGWYAGHPQILEVATGRLVRRLEGHAIGVASLRFNPDGTRLATAGFDRTVWIWSAASLPEFVSLEGHEQAVWAIAFSRDGKRVASGSLDQTARIWDAETGDSPTVINVGFPVVSLAFSPEGDRLVTVAPNHTACIWPVQTNRDSRSSRREEALTKIRNGESLLTSAATNAELIRLRGHTGTVMAVAWSADGKRILTGSKDGTARLWDATTGLPIRTVPAHTNWVLSVAFSPDGRRFATGSADNTARVLEANTGRLLRVLEGHSDWVQQVAFSPDGQRIATGSRDRKARLFDANTGRLLFSMEGHRSGVSSLGFSPDSSRLATAGAGEDLKKVANYERAALLWDLHTGQRLLKLDAHLNWVVAVAFSPDGQRLATGSGDNTVRIREAFPWKPEEYAAEAGASPGEKLESFKRRYWQNQLQSAPGAVPLGTRALRSGRRLETYYGATSELNLSAKSGTKTRPAQPIPPRAAGSDPNLIDLTGSYNAALTETLQPNYGIHSVDRNLSSLPAGVHTLAGVSFDVRGIIHLSQATWGCAALPTTVEIPVGHRFRRMHVLHGAASPAVDGTQIGTYRLHYRDGGSADLPIVHGRDVRGMWAYSWSVSDSVEALAQASEAELAWTGVADQTQPDPPKARLYKRTYDNPAPEREVVRIAFESTMTTSGPLLIAVTVEP